MYDLRVIVAVVVLHQLDIRTCTAQNVCELFEQCMSEYRAGVKLSVNEYS